MAFYPGDGFNSICTNIAQQADYLLIIDNSTECALLPQNINLPDNAIIVYNQNNGAVSGALNIALELARFKKFNYLQIFDHDTVPPSDITEGLIKTIEEYPNAAIVSPRFFNSDTNYPGRLVLKTDSWRIVNLWPQKEMGVLRVLVTITSGALINIKLVPADFIYDERLIVDGCDIDFCLCLRSAGYEILVDTKQCIYHGLGYKKKGGWRWSALNYSPFRKFLTAKNRIMTWRRYWKEYPGYVLSDFNIFLLDTARTILFEENKLSKINAIAKGIWLGFKEKDIKQRLKIYNN
jgi:rhamnosyltransferase